jgi:N-acyl-D-amino-acid deacylase
MHNQQMSHRRTLRSALEACPAGGEHAPASVVARRDVRITVILGSLLIACGSAFAQPQSTVIQGAAVVDGTGAPIRTADVRIIDGRIAAVGALAPSMGEQRIDARGLTLAPGFIDTHSHHDRGVFENRGALAAVSQGITTIVVGQDGGFADAAPADSLATFFARLESHPVAVNVASYAGHGSIRRKVMGADYKRAAADAEVERMRHLLREEMRAGALGLSTGLEYDPGVYSTPEEVLELAKVAAAAGGRYISHMRSEDREFWQALDELLNIGRVARIPVQISHMKLGMRGLWGQSGRLIATLDRARRDGVEVSADVYPYTMWQSSLTTLYPKRNFTDRGEAEFILKQVAGPDDLLVSAFAPNPSYAGRTVRQIAHLRKTDPTTTLMALMEMIVDARAGFPDEGVVATGMDERDIIAFYRWPFTNVCSDGALDGAHPRGFGSFPRVLGRYVREQRVLTLEEAVRKMTSLSAANMGVADRGLIKAGMGADLVLFNAAAINDRATLSDPHALSVGVKLVWVNGVIVYEDGKTTEAFPGRVLRRGGSRTLDRQGSGAVPSTRQAP